MCESGPGLTATAGLFITGWWVTVTDGLGPGPGTSPVQESYEPGAGMTAGALVSSGGETRANNNVCHRIREKTNDLDIGENKDFTFSPGVASSLAL